MAEKINLDDSKINITFNQDNSLDESTQINRLGLNGKVSMKNSHINVVGDEKDGISPARHYATMFLVGELLGEKSSIFLKSHQGAVLRTDSNVKIAGKNSKDDLKITAITTGKKMGNEIIDRTACQPRKITMPTPATPPLPSAMNLTLRLSSKMQALPH